MNPLSMGNVEVFLKRTLQHLKKDMDLAVLIDTVHTTGINAPAQLLMVMEKCLSGLTPQQAIAGLGEETTNTFAICKAVTSGNWNTLRSLMTKVGAEEARLVRASIGGWLRGILLKDGNPKRQRVAAESLLELMQDAPLDDTNLMLWLVPTLYKICRRFTVSV